MRIAPLLLLAAIPAAPQTFEKPPHVKEELICERPDKDHYWQFPWAQVGEATPDLSKVVWLSRREGPWFVMVNGETLGPLADERAEWTIGPAGQILRAGRLAKSWFVWQNGEQIAGPFDEVKGVQYTRDGRVAFAIKRAKNWTWIVGGKEEQITGTDTQRMAAAGGRVAYDIKGPLGWSMVVDGKAGPVFDTIVAAEFSPDGARFIYLGVRDGRMVPVVDGKEEQVRANVDGIRFSADSKRLAYVAMDTPKKEAVVGRIVLDGVPGRAHPAVLLDLDRLLRVAYFDLKNIGIWRPPDLWPMLTGTTAPTFRADGKIIYAGSAPSGGDGVWLEGEDKPLFPASSVVAGPILSSKGERVGWVETRDGQWTGVVDGQRGPATPTNNKRVNDVSDLTLSPDGSRIAFVHIAGGGSYGRGLASHALRRVVATGHEGKTYDAAGTTNLRFSADGSHLAYEVHQAKGFDHPGSKNGSFVVLDGVPGRIYSNVLPGTMRFTDADTVMYVARLQDVKDGPYRYYRVTQSAPAARQVSLPRSDPQPIWSGIPIDLSTPASRWLRWSMTPDTPRGDWAWGPG